MRDVFSTSFPDMAATNLLDAIPHGIAVIDRDLKIVAINEFLEALTGVVRADITGVYVDFVLRSNIARRGRHGPGENRVLLVRAPHWAACPARLFCRYCLLYRAVQHVPLIGLSPWRRRSPDTSAPSLPVHVCRKQGADAPSPLQAVEHSHPVVEQDSCTKSRRCIFSGGRTP